MAAQWTLAQNACIAPVQELPAVIRHLKTAQPAHTPADNSTQVQATVARIIADVAARGDEAVRQYSHQFDLWAPVRWRLTDDEISACMASLSPQEI